MNRKQPIPAAAVAFVRDTEKGIEVYLSRRPAHFRYYGGAFVFPGGMADPEDADMRATAAREVREEIGFNVDPQRLLLLRETHTSPHAGPIYHMLTFAYSVDGEFRTSLNEDEVDEEVWIPPGEALVRLRRSDPNTLSLIPEHPQMIAFRNILIHGYDAIDHRRVWDAIENSLPQLFTTVEDLLKQSPPAP